MALFLLSPNCMADTSGIQPEPNDDAFALSDQDRLTLKMLGFQIPINGNLSAQWKAFLRAQAGDGEASSPKE